QQGDYIAKIADLAEGARLAIDKFDYTDINRVIDLLYKFTPANWDTLRGIFPSMFTGEVNSAISQIEQMNSFFGINMATQPFQGFTKPSIAWLIPILAGLTQYVSTKLMSANQPQPDSENPMAQTMNQMVVTMPLVSVFICFTLPAAVGIYWVVQGLLTLVQQMYVNKRMENIDADELVRRNVEKANKKRARQGLPPMNVSSDTKESRKIIQSNEEKAAREEREAAIKRARSAKQTAESDAYYKNNARPGSLASKAGMVKRFNEKNEKSEKHDD
nr:YidC/Oxa1 family membrane protein insertase [Lachnospiraceae bacterium]